MRILRGARNGEDYQKHNKFKGGKVILKVKGRQSLIYLSVDDIKAQGQ
jgi:hypothetical protein